MHTIHLALFTVVSIGCIIYTGYNLRHNHSSVVAGALTGIPVGVLLALLHLLYETPVVK